MDVAIVDPVLVLMLIPEMLTNEWNTNVRTFVLTTNVLKWPYDPCRLNRCPRVILRFESVSKYVLIIVIVPKDHSPFLCA